MSQSEYKSAFMMDKDYYVVEFPEEEKNGDMPMAVIPFTWMILNEDNKPECLWPINFRSDDEIKKAALKKIELQRNSCTVCRINIKFKTDSYERAVARLKELEANSSQWSTCDEDNGRIRRRKIRRNPKYDDFLGESSDENSCNIPDVPKPTKQIDLTLKHSYKGLEVSKPCSSRKNVGLIISDLPVHSLNESDEPVRKKEDSNRTLTQSLVDEQDVPVNTFNQLNRCCQRTEALVQKLITTVGVMARDLQCVTRMVQHMHSPLTTLEDIAHTKNLPASRNLHLENFNRTLEEDDVFAETCSHFQIIGGKDYVDVVRRLLPKIISHCLCLEYNWTGRNGKYSFKELDNIVKLIITVVRRNPMCRDVTQIEIETTIKSWLRSSSDRNGGRDRRRKENRNNDQ